MPGFGESTRSTIRLLAGLAGLAYYFAAHLDQPVLIGLLGTMIGIDLVPKGKDG